MHVASITSSPLCCLLLLIFAFVTERSAKVRNGSRRLVLGNIATVVAKPHGHCN